ncbi:hypothetical protein BpHYR1_003580, partial [Brachionus plicatilis]
RWFIIFSTSKIASSFPPLEEGDLSNFNLWSGNVSDSFCLKTSSTIRMTRIHTFEPDFALSMFWSAVGYLSSIRSLICLTRSSTALSLKSGSIELQSLNPFIFLPNISSNEENFVAECILVRYASNTNALNLAIGSGVVCGCNNMFRPDSSYKIINNLIVKFFTLIRHEYPWWSKYTYEFP